MGGAQQHTNASFGGANRFSGPAQNQSGNQGQNQTFNPNAVSFGGTGGQQRSFGSIG